MELSKDKIKKLSQKIYWSKMRLLVNHGFFGSLLLGMNFALTTELDKEKAVAATNGETIVFHPETLDALSDRELDITIMHELMHIALKHHLRGKNKKKARYNLACDIVVNSNIMYSKNLYESEMLILGHHLPHLAPNGQEGYLYSAEEVYEMLTNLNQESTDIAGDEDDEKEKVAADTMMTGKGNDNGLEKEKGKDKNAGDPTMSDKKKDDIDPTNSDKNKDDQNENITEKGEKQKKKTKDTYQPIDSHDRWEDNKDKLKEDMATKKTMEAYELASHRKDAGSIPLSVKRYINDLRNPTTDWRTLLNNFVQENIVDYSFCPPDKRFSDGDFILPDFNDPDEVVKNILFMIDTSGSMSEKEISDCFSEINGAIQQFNGKLAGFVGFFDAKVQKIVPFDSFTDIREIIPQGGGGTDFHAIFKHVKRHMQDELPSSIVILTDGYADFPKEEETLGIPLLWIINNNKSTPPFGLVTRINVNK